MRTILLLLLATFFLSVTTYSQKKQTDLEFDGIKGKVKSVQASSMYLGTKDKPEESPKRDYSTVKSYGLDGNITEDLDAERGIKYVYQFVDGFLSMKEVVIDKKKASNIMRASLIGSAEDMETPVKTIKPDERFISRFDDEYDGKGRLKLRRIFFSDGRMNSITLYSYNQIGLLETEVYNSFGNKWTNIYSYDANRNETENLMKRSNPNGIVDMTNRTEYSDYKFDDKGNWIERKYTYHSEYANKSTTSEGFEYRDIKYYDENIPKKKPTTKRKK